MHLEEVPTAGRNHLGRVGEGGVAVRRQTGPSGRWHGCRGFPCGLRWAELSRGGSVAGIAAAPSAPQSPASRIRGPSQPVTGMA